MNLKNANIDTTVLAFPKLAHIATSEKILGIEALEVTFKNEPLQTIHVITNESHTKPTWSGAYINLSCEDLDPEIQKNVKAVYGDIQSVRAYYWDLDESETKVLEPRLKLDEEIRIQKEENIRLYREVSDFSKESKEADDWRKGFSKMQILLNERNALRGVSA